MSKIRLNCCVTGDKAEDVFPIWINPTDDVASLKSTIESLEQFHHVPKNRTKLWAVSISLNNNFPKTLGLPSDARGPLRSWTRLTALFEQVELEAENLHVVIERPPPPPRILRLKYYIYGKEIRGPLGIKIDAGEDVSELKDAIKAADNDLFEDISARELNLWAVSFPDQAILNSINDHIFSGGEPLPPGKLLSEVFPDLPIPGYVHIVVQIPSDDTLTPLGFVWASRTKRYNVITRQQIPPPPTLAQREEFETFQRRDGYFACTRPLNREPNTPLTLLHRVFATFVEESQTATLTARDYAVARHLRQLMCGFYKDEDSRTFALCRELMEYGIHLAPGKIGLSRSSTDGHLAPKNRPVLILETKNEIGLGGADPSIQAMAYYDVFCEQYRLWEETSLHPCFILFLAGPFMGIGGCVLTSRPTLELFSFLPLNFHRSNDVAYDTLTRHLSALKTGVASLVTLYSELPAPGPPQDPPPSQRSLPRNYRYLFPYPTSFTSLSDQKKRMEFSYTGGPPEGDSLIFTGEMGDSQILIKFVRRYGEDVHRWCSQRALAPRLFGFEELPGGWFMVVMERLDESWVRLYDTKKAKFQETLKEPIRAAITQLHQDGHMVHGDLRDTNIMVKKIGGPGFMFVDFDWAGRVGKVNYPKFMNPDPAIGRPVAATDCSPILPEHDDHMFQFLFT